MFQLSLRSLLVLVALVTLAIVSLRFASQEWLAAILAVTLVAFLASLIIAVVDRGTRQAAAVGFALSMATYGLILALMPLEGSNSRRYHPEFNPGTGRLLTTQLLGLLYGHVAEIYWVDLDAGDKLVAHGANNNTSWPPTLLQNASLEELPDRKVFAAIGHLWWAMLLGLCGGWFARLVYLRRMRQHDSLAADRS